MSTHRRIELEHKIEAAMKLVRAVLDDTKAPRVAADVDHVYDDKFILAETVATMALAAERTLFASLGLDDEKLGEVRSWERREGVVLRFSSRETCRLDREETRTVETGGRRRQETSEGILGEQSRTVDDTFYRKETKYHWRFEAEHALVVTSLVEASASLTLCRGHGRCEIVTTTDKPPRPEVAKKPDHDLSLAPLLDAVDDELRVGFSIRRAHPECHTPRRNDDVDGLWEALSQLEAWCHAVVGYLRHELFAVDTDHGRELAVLDRELFVPVLPLLREPDTEGAHVHLPEEDIAALLEHHRTTLDREVGRLGEAFADDGSLVGLGAARVVATLAHGRALARQGCASLQYIEQMLEDQLVAAIGKVVTPADFSEYMQHHARKVFAPEVAPRPFHHPVRRPEHVPEGTVALEQRQNGAPEPIVTFARHGAAEHPMRVLLDAATQVEVFGERHVHGWVDHQFSGQRPTPLTLTARAREFSSFVLLVGKIVSADRFDPKAAMIVQNKDDLRIPLVAETIPTPKEFRDAIVSLSPEQRRFAQAYRGMQLEGTLFGVMVIQIKPQLEALLRLPADSLTKEIELTQHLLDLFVRYQVPSDLVSYDGPGDASAADKVAAVTDHVERMRRLIQRQKDAELEEQRQRQAQQFAEVEGQMAMQVTHVGGPPPPAPGGYGGGGPVAGAATAWRAAQAPPPPSAAAPPPAAGPPMARSGGSAPRAAPTAPPPPSPPAGAASSTPSRTPPTADAHAAAGMEDYTRLPVDLDRDLERLDEDDAMRPTLLDLAKRWSLRRRRSLLSPMEKFVLREEEQREERQRAFDLLDALSRSGSLPVHHADLHVVVAATHRFDKSLTETVIQKSDNPIEKVERSTLIVASTIFGRPPAELTRPAELPRLRELSARLFESPPEDD